MDLDALNVRDHLATAVAEVPDAPLVLWGEEEITYGMFAERAERAARAWHDLGVRQGDRVAFVLDNSPDFLVAWFGLAQLGAVLVAVNTGFRQGEAAYLLQHSGARFVLAGEPHRELVVPLVREIATLEGGLTLGADPVLPDLRERWASASGAAPRTHLRGDDVVSFIYTSGTTGKPKAVMQTHRNYVLTGQAYPSWMRMDRGDRIYACLPLFHINSQSYSMMGAIGARGAVGLAPRFSARTFWSDIRRYRIAVFNFIGAMSVILSEKAPSEDDRDHVVKVAYGVPALPEQMRADLERRFGFTILSGFGMSETTFGLLEPWEGRKPGTMGLPRHHPDPSVPRTAAMVVDGDGREAAPGVVGELVLRTPATMLGYFRDPEQTAEAFRGGWLHTGDLARRDEDGYFFFVDRAKDIVRRRGENISSLEVENVLSEHPAVVEAAVLGVPAELTDEDVLAVVVPRDGAEVDPQELVDWCADRLAPFKVPRFVEFASSLPKTHTQKVEKHRLRAALSPSDRWDREAIRRS